MGVLACTAHSSRCASANSPGWNDLYGTAESFSQFLAMLLMAALMAPLYCAGVGAGVLCGLKTLLEGPPTAPN